MPDIDISEVAGLGVIRDEQAHRLPPEAWSLGENVRVQDEGIKRLPGWDEVFNDPPVDPHFTMAVSTPAQTFWPYVSLTKAYVWDGTTHTDITRTVGGDYAASNTEDWNGTLLGGVAIFNNGVDIPQFWATPSIGTDLANLPNWPVDLRAKVIRSISSFLVAINLTDGSDSFPHAVQWSHPADPGSVPISWDITDPTKDAGRVDLPDVNSGPAVDALLLRDALYIYKDNATWRMRFVGGQFIFAFDPFLTTSGLLAARCATVLGDGQRHFVVTQDDILVHNGNTAESIGEKRFKRYLFNQIDVTNFRRSFCFTNPNFSECVLCYPTAGQLQPNRAVIWNYGNNTFTEADINFRNAAIGQVEVNDLGIWDTDSQPWNEDVTPWSTLQRRKVVVCDPANSRFNQLDVGTTRNGATFSATLQRQTLGLMGRDRNGKWIENFDDRKFFKRVWPKIRGGPVRIRVGFQDFVTGSITWSDQMPFDPSNMMYLDFEQSGRAISIEFATTDPVDWTLDGYTIEAEYGGRF